MSKTARPEDGMTYEEIAEVLGMTKKQVYAIEQRALKKLKRPTPENKKFLEYLRQSVNKANSNEHNVLL